MATCGTCRYWDYHGYGSLGDCRYGKRRGQATVTVPGGMMLVGIKETKRREPACPHYNEPWCCDQGHDWRALRPERRLAVSECSRCGETSTVPVHKSTNPE